MIKLSNLNQTYATADGQVHALVDVCLDIAAGEMVLARGPSGSGKSTLLLAAGGMRRPTSGTVAIDGQDLYGLSPGRRSQLRGTTLGFVFQSFNLIPYLSALDNVLLAAGEQNAAIRERAAALLTDLGLSQRLTHRPSQLSQGEQQRVALARAAINRPKALLADEPTGNLDPANADIVFRALRRYADDGAAVLAVTHAISHLEIADRVLTFDQGRLLPGEPAHA